MFPQLGQWRRRSMGSVLERSVEVWQKGDCWKAAGSTPASPGLHHMESAGQAKLLLPLPCMSEGRNFPYPCMDASSLWLKCIYQCWIHKSTISNRQMEKGRWQVRWLAWLVSEWAERQLLHRSSKLLSHGFSNHVKISFVCMNIEKMSRDFLLLININSAEPDSSLYSVHSKQSLYLSSQLLRTSIITNESTNTLVTCGWLFPKKLIIKCCRLLWGW